MIELEGTSPPKDTCTDSAVAMLCLILLLSVAFANSSKMTNADIRFELEYLLAAADGNCSELRELKVFLIGVQAVYHAQKQHNITPAEFALFVS